MSGEDSIQAVLPGPDLADARRVIRAALAEDLCGGCDGDFNAAATIGDLTSNLVVPGMARFSGVLQARHRMVPAGLPVAAEVFRLVVPEARFQLLVADGTMVEAGTVLAEIEGPARGLLTAERTALNLLQVLSGIATATSRFVAAIQGTGCILLDTRKTLPGLRLLSKYATRCGGARNHRLGLYDAILIKDNHIAVCGGVSAAIARARASGAQAIEVECDNLSQVAEALEAGVERILLDNMSLADLRRAVRLIDGRAATEASGGVTLDTVRPTAETGVDFVSVGHITQSAPAMDIGLDWQADPAAMIATAPMRNGQVS